MRRGGVVRGGGVRGCGDEERALGRHGGGRKCRPSAPEAEASSAADFGRRRRGQRRRWGAEDFLGVESFLLWGSGIGMAVRFSAMGGVDGDFSEGFFLRTEFLDHITVEYSVVRVCFCNFLYTFNKHHINAEVFAKKKRNE